ncbi:MAG: hypothetical protein K5989_06195, partial [Lachnospiraceae bacterium]|nr:hypothetical protein [Lachnospiraceae bacterium]
MSDRIWDIDEIYQENEYMGMQEIGSKQTLHAVGDRVETIEIVLKGAIKATDGNAEVILKNGAMIGNLETPG